MVLPLAVDHAHSERIQVLEGDLKRRGKFFSFSFGGGVMSCTAR